MPLLGEESEQRSQVTEVGAPGVVGTAPFQSEVLVELVENHVHVDHGLRRRPTALR